MFIEIEGNITTGFNWQCSISDYDSLILLEQRYLDAEKDLLGRGGIFVFEFLALKPNPITLHFEYCQPWQADKIAYSLMYRVNIDENLTITIEEVEGNYFSDTLPTPRIVREDYA